MFATLLLTVWAAASVFAVFVARQAVKRRERYAARLEEAWRRHVGKNLHHECVDGVHRWR